MYIPRIRHCLHAVLAAACSAVFLCLAGCAPAASSSSLAAPVVAPVTQPPFRSNLDFAALQANNADTIGWIEVPGTVIDYPVMRGVDNIKYLKTDENGEESLFGAIFTDMSNSDDFLSPVTVAYGHYTPEDAYFTQLHSYKDPTYFAENREVYIYTPNSQMRYEIVAAFTIGDENILYEKDYTNPEEMQGFVDWMANTTEADANLALENTSADDRFLMMSTCVQQVGGENRYAVIARLVETR